MQSTPKHQKRDDDEADGPEIVHIVPMLPEDALQVGA